MKRLLILTAVAMLALSATGCQSCRWFHRNETCVPACSAPCPAYAPCDTCGPAAAQVYPGPVQ